MKETNSTVWKRCYESHPALKLTESLVIYGGSCRSPVVKDADVYVGLDSGLPWTEKCYPWTPGIEFLYSIPDMGVPKDPETFKQLVAWLAEQLIAGKKVHVGCIGGHGRTGMLFAALVKVMVGEEDAITYVRKNYCDRAVESDAQMKFLHEHFGIKKVGG